MTADLPTGWRRRIARLHPVAIAVFGILVALGALWDRVSHARPSYDAFGWLVWGHQTLYGHLNTSAAPSWKPLTFLFTVPYALFGRTQISLWTLTASTAAIASAVFAARIAFRLARPRPARVLPRDEHARGREAEATSSLSRGPAILRDLGAGVGAVAAGVGVLFMSGFSHQVLIATSDPMVVTLVLAAVDAHLSRRPGLGFGLLVLASLGRPEAWPFLGLDGLWLAWKLPRLRPAIVIGFLIVPVGWFLIPGLTSRSWFISGDLALNFPGAIHGNKLVGITQRFLGLYGVPVRIAVAAAIVWAVARRDRLEILLVVASVLWVAVEWAFALHGWPASQRYIMEPGAVLIAITGAAIGRALGLAATGWRRSAPRIAPARAADVALRLVALGAVVVLALAIVPTVRGRASLLSTQIEKADFNAIRIARLGEALADDGGSVDVRRCGQPVTLVGFQSTFAWYLGVNVGHVGYKPEREIRSGRPIVMFRPDGLAWRIDPIHTSRAHASACARLARELTPSMRFVALQTPVHRRHHCRGNRRGRRHGWRTRTSRFLLLVHRHHRDHGRDDRRDRQQA